MKLVQPQFGAAQIKLASPNQESPNLDDSSLLSYALLSGSKDDFQRLDMRKPQNKHLNKVVQGNYKYLPILEALQTHFSKFKDQLGALPDNLTILLKAKSRSSDVLEVILQGKARQNYEHSESDVLIESSLGAVNAETMREAMGERILNEVIAKANGVARALIALNSGPQVDQTNNPNGYIQ